MLVWVGLESFRRQDTNFKLIHKHNMVVYVVWKERSRRQGRMGQSECVCVSKSECGGAQACSGCGKATRVCGVVAHTTHRIMSGGGPIFGRL